MRLLYLDINGIKELIEKFDQDIKALKRELFKICWYMRGSISLTEAHELTQEDREILSKIVEENLEYTQKTGLPFF